MCLVLDLLVTLWLLHIQRASAPAQTVADGIQKADPWQTAMISDHGDD
jgi:hypothetical protein